MYLNSYPLVEVTNTGEAKSLNQQNMCEIELEGHLTIQKYSEIGKDIKIKIEVLNL